MMLLLGKKEKQLLAFFSLIDGGGKGGEKEVNGKLSWQSMSTIIGALESGGEPCAFFKIFSSRCERNHQHQVQQKNNYRVKK